MFFSTQSSLFTSVQLKVLITTPAVCSTKLELFYNKDREVTYIQRFLKNPGCIIAPEFPFLSFPSFTLFCSPRPPLIYFLLPQLFPFSLPLFLCFLLPFLCLQYFIFLPPQHLSSFPSLDFFTQTL